MQQAIGPNYFTTAEKNIIQLVDGKVWWRNVAQHGKYSEVLRIAHGKAHHVCLKYGRLFRAQHKYIQNSLTSQGYTKALKMNIFEVTAVSHFVNILSGFRNS